ncbi:MAG: DUF6506 family protein [Bacillota bacterium]|nr:DUF6506 family protein [Bacillota bacterium]
MLKFAWLVNVPGSSPEKYNGVYENAESYNLVAGTGDMESAKAYVKKLADEGYTLFNLCGDFDDDVTAEMSALAGEGVKIRHADYLPAELEKVSALEEFSEYGIVVVMRGVEEPSEVEINADGMHTRAIFVKDQEQANAAAKKLSDAGMHGIELCSWFDKEKTESVIDAIGGATPVGSCGEL